jgi:hypothetical protein
MRCWTRDCKNETSKGRRYCNTCRSRKYRERYPLKAMYDALKMNAKRRRKEFTLTFIQFKNFCAQTDYQNKKGRKADSFTIDREDNSKGYSFENIRAITLSENVKRNTEFPDEFKPEPNKITPF